MKYAGLLLALMVSTASASPNVLNGTAHAAGSIAPAIVATAGSGVVDSSIFVDYDSAASSATDLIAASTNSSGTYTSVASGTSVNHQPYAVMNLSMGGYSLSQDFANYSALLADSAMLAWPPAIVVNGSPRAGTAPPLLIAGATSHESTDGGTGWGVEFALENTSCASACGLDVSTDSSVSAALAGFIAALKHSQSSWNYFDVKAALRQTAANWPTYSHANFGYGVLHWPAANLVSTIYLQPPNMAVQNNGYYLAITLYPFRQTRRSKEVVYSVSSSYSWPAKNEYTTSDITASGGTLIYTSNGTDTTPQFSWQPAMSGTVTLVAFTTDGSGNYSAVQEFGPTSQVLTISGVCQ